MIPSKNGQSISENGIQCWNDKPILWPQVLAALTTAFVQLGIGVIGGFTGVALPALTNANSTDIYLNVEQVSLFSSIQAVSCIVGSFLTGFIMNWFGQRIALLVSLPFGICGWLILTFASNIKLLILSRCMVGILWGATMACIIYVVEISHTSVRGRLLASIDLMRQVGFVFVAVIGSIGLHWRYVGLICGMVSLIPPLICIIFLPNSPRWLATKGRREEARKALSFFRGSSYDVDKELSEIISQLETSMQDDSFMNKVKLLKNKSLLQRFIALSIMMILVQFTGAIVIATYTITIFQSANTGIDKYISTVASTSMRVFGAATYIVIADKFNRKCLLIVPLSFSTVSIAVLGTYFYVMLNHDVQFIAWLPLASIIVYFFSTAIYFSALTLIASELMPTAVRTEAGSAHFLLLSVGMFVMVYFYPYMIETLGSHWTYWFYAANAFAIILIAAMVIPETKGKSLEEIAEIK